MNFVGFEKYLYALVLSFLTLPWNSNGELDDEDMYPIIISTNADKAIFIVPEIGCHVMEDARLIERVAFMRKQHVYNADGKTVENIIDLCENYQSDKINASQFVIGLREKSFWIYPGTHFCGAGNDAANETDLGYYVETDKCCREHDSCNDFVSGWSCHSTMPELCNVTPFTRSNCICDQKFRSCLQRAEETASTHIGILYFTVFGLKCFRKDYPIIDCEEYGGFLNIHCQKYKLDESKEQIYQFFDSPKFSRGKITPSNSTSISALFIAEHAINNTFVQ